MNSHHQTTQDTFMIMERLAALCATPGINEKTQEIANEQIQALLSSVVKDSVSKLTAKGAGLLV
jgi:hypothetical protein